MKYDQYLFYLGLFYFVILKKKNKNYVILYAVEKIEAILTVFLNFFYFIVSPKFWPEDWNYVTHTFEEASFLWVFVLYKIHIKCMLNCLGVFVTSSVDDQMGLGKRLFPLFRNNTNLYGTCFPGRLIKSWIDLVLLFFTFCKLI